MNTDIVDAKTLPKPKPKKTTQNRKWKCPICLSTKVYPMMTNCGHSTCHNCYKKINKCPLCKKKILFAKNNYDLADICKVKPMSNSDKFSEINDILAARHYMNEEYVDILALEIYEEICKNIESRNKDKKPWSILIIYVKSKLNINSSLISKLINHINFLYGNKLSKMIEITLSKKHSNPKYTIKVSVISLVDFSNTKIDEILVDEPKLSKFNNIFQNYVSMIEEYINKYSKIILNEFESRFNIENMLKPLTFNVTIDDPILPDLIIYIEKYIESRLNRNTLNIEVFSIEYISGSIKCCFNFKYNNDKFTPDEELENQIVKLDDVLAKNIEIFSNYLVKLCKKIMNRFTKKLQENIYDNTICFSIKLDKIINKNLLKEITNYLQKNVISSLKQDIKFALSVDGMNLDCTFILYGKPNIYPMNEIDLEEYSDSEETSEDDF